jgi:hypothetical protein
MCDCSSVVVQFVEEQMQLQVHYIFLEQCIIYFFVKMSSCLVVKMSSYFLEQSSFTDDGAQ